MLEFLNQASEALARADRPKRQTPLLYLLLLGLLFLLAFAIAPAGPGSAGAATVDGVRILSPADGGLIGKRQVTVRIKVGKSVKSIRVTSGARKIDSKRFRRAPGGLRVARLRFKTGYQRLAVRASLRGGGSSFENISFTVGKHRKGLLSLRRTNGSGAANFTLRTRRSIEGMKVKLNGRRLRSPFEQRGKRVHLAELGAHDGLRPGRNSLTVRVHESSGRYEVRTLRFHMPRSHPIAGAGRDRRTDVGRGVRLDGRSSRLKGRPGKLVYRWKLVGKPKGSKARLSRVRRPLPVLRPDRHGTYRVKLTVSKRGAGGSGAALQARTDIVEIDALPPTPPIGLPVETIASTGGAGIRIGDWYFSAESPSTKLCSRVTGSVASEVSRSSTAGAS